MSPHTSQHLILHLRVFEKNQRQALNYFDPSKPTILQVNASKHDLGTALLQEGKSIAYVSKSLT